MRPRVRGPARRWRKRCLSAVLTIFLCGAAVSAAQDASEYYERALQRFNEGDPRGAYIESRNALQIDAEQRMSLSALVRSST